MASSGESEASIGAIAGPGGDDLLAVSNRP
jgi:hypothetical protein